MRKIFYLSTCDTCQRILKQLKIPADVALIDIKTRAITAEELDWFQQKVGSYEALFSKRAIKYRSLGLNEQTLTEEDFKAYLLQEYTFLKRPFIAYDDHCWIGNAKKEVDAAVAFFDQL
jgi:arsenate reductase (glutaredoxin)